MREIANSNPVPNGGGIKLDRQPNLLRIASKARGLGCLAVVVESCRSWPEKNYADGRSLFFYQYIFIIVAGYTNRHDELQGVFQASLSNGANQSGKSSLAQKLLQMHRV